MTIPMLGGWGDSLAPVSQAIASIVDKKMHPNRHMEEVMQQAFAQNPDLLQKFADMEKNAPGTAERLGLGRLANIIKFVPESADQQLQNETKGLKKEATIAALTSSKATNEYNAKQMQDYAAFAKDHPDVTFDSWLKKETGKTGADQQEQALDIAGKKIIINEKTREADLVAHLPPVDGLNMVKYANLLSAGHAEQVPPDQLAAIFSDPVRAKPFQALLTTIAQRKNNEQQDRGLALQERGVRVSEQNSQTQRDALALRGSSNEQFIRNQAQEAFEKSGYQGTLDAWERILYKPDDMKRAKDLLAGTIKPTGIDDQALMAAAKSRQEQDDYKTLLQANTVNKAVSTALTKVESAGTDTERALNIRVLNSLLGQRAKLGGEKLTATWDDPWYRGGRVTFKDSKGNEIDPAKAQEILTDPDATDIMTSRDTSLLSAASQSIVDAVKSSKNPAQAIAQLKMQDFSPGKTVTAQAENELRRKGIIK